MRGKRLWQTLRLCMIPSSIKRTEYLKRNGCFGAIGENCSIMDRKVPLYARLIRLGNNVRIASHVTFVTHDITSSMINRLPEEARGGRRVKEKIGCIRVGDNVFIGTNTTILYDVSIGSNVVIGAGSLVNRDIPDNSIAAGVPARVIGSFEEYIQKRIREECAPADMAPAHQEVSEELADWCWAQFEAKRQNARNV